MKPYLNAGFGEPLGQETLNLISSLGFQGVRQDLPQGREDLLIDEFRPEWPHGLRLLGLVNGGKMAEDPEPAGARAAQVSLKMWERGIVGEIEIGNEPNIARDRYSSNPDELSFSIRTAWDIMQADPRLASTRLVVGGIMNTDRGGLTYLEQVLHHLPSNNIVVGYHTYRQHSTPDVPNKGFSSREEEFQWLQEMAHGRELWMTEVGWHSAKEKSWCFGKPKGISDDEVYRRLQGEADYNIRAGAEVMVTFQLNDGPGDGYEHRFGIRNFEGVLKPSSGIAEWIGGR